MACIDSVERALSISTKADISRLQNTIENTKAALQDSQSDVIRLRGKTGSVVEDARTRVAALGVIFMGCQMNIYYYSSTWHKIIITLEVNRYNNSISPNVKRKIIAKNEKSREDKISAEIVVSQNEACPSPERLRGNLPERKKTYEKERLYTTRAGGVSI